jgi:hypothetical protein
VPAVSSVVRVSAVGLALFLLLEGTARLVVFGPGGLDPRRVGIWRDLDPAELVRFETEPDLVYEYKPDLDLFFKGVHFRTNSRGMRDREYALEKPAGTFRVAVLGSSFTLPVGVEIEDAFHSLLEERCSRERAPERCEFLNFAVGMHGPGQFLAMLRHRALAFEPDLVLVSVTALAAPRMFADFRDVPPRDVLRLVAPHGRSILVKLIQSRLGLGRLPFGSSPLALPPSVPEPQQVVAQLGELSRALQLPLVVVRLEYDPAPPTALERTLEARVLREGMLYLDTRSAFRGERPQDFWIHELDPHPNQRAHASFADVLEAFLRSHDLFSGSRTRTERSVANP